MVGLPNGSSRYQETLSSNLKESFEFTIISLWFVPKISAISRDSFISSYELSAESSKPTVYEFNS